MYLNTENLKCQFRQRVLGIVQFKLQFLANEKIKITQDPIPSRHTNQDSRKGYFLFSSTANLDNRITKKPTTKHKENQKTMN